MTDDSKNKEDKEYFKKLNNVIDFALFSGDKKTAIYTFMIYKSWNGDFTYSQLEISKILNISRKYVNKTINKFVINGLFIKKKHTHALGTFNSYEIAKIIEHNEINDRLENNSSQGSEQEFSSPNKENNISQGSEPEFSEEGTEGNTLNKSINTSKYLKEIKKKKDEKKRKRK